MKKYILKRILISLVTLLVVLLLLFVLLKLMPGTPFNDEKLNEAQKAALLAKYGLDQPIIVQFFNYVTNMLHGDLGVSYNISKNTPIAQLLQTRLPTSLRIGGQAVVLGAIIGLVLGIIAALKHNSFWDTLCTIVSVLGVSVPSYVFALFLAYTCGFQLGWFPQLYQVAHPFMSSVLPSVALSMFTIASIARFTRSEMLEVLDSEQNHAFRDHFLEVPLDLSQVMFITTANSLDTIPRPLLDRMEVIQLSSYTDEEKIQIAKNHLLPKQMKEHGLKKGVLRIDDEAVRAVIRDYTRESGVRQLERRLAALCRKADMQLLTKAVKRVTVTEKGLPKLLNMQPYPPTVHVDREEIGVVNGLAWTEAGGEILEVEVNVMEGSGKLELTGNLGDVMKESAQAAYSCLRSRAKALGIDPDFYKNRDIHVHFPEGAVPKDGPSAGIAMATAMLSVLTDRKIKAGIAMTGEITLRGRVLPIGGLKEKTMAAMRIGITTVIIPRENEKDLEEIDPTVRSALKFVTTDHVDKILDVAFGRRFAAAVKAAHSDAHADTANVNLRQ